MRSLAIVAVLAASIAAPASAKCFTAHFEAVGVQIAVNNPCTLTPCPVYAITGQLKNNCPQPAGAALKITAFDAKGLVVTTAEAWPASVRNIAPGGLYAFDMGSLILFDERIKTATVEIIDVRTW